MNRRGFLGALGGAAAAAAAWLAWDNRVGIRRVVAHVPMERRIHDALPGLDLDPGGVRAFVAAHEALHGRERRGGWTDPEIPLTYLASTDYFRPGADADGTVRFVAYYDPYASPCWNPCASRWTPEGAAATG